LLERHRSLTGSPRASQVLDDWDAVSGTFLHLVPRPDLEVIVRLQEGTVSTGSGADDNDGQVASVTRS
jgi:glutamate synthase domain-containing protein 3